MPVSAYILIVSNRNEPRIVDCLEKYGYAFSECTADTFDISVITNSTPDLVLWVAEDGSLKKSANLPDFLADQAIPVLVVGSNPSPERYHSITTTFSDIELQKRIGSLVRLQIMQRELVRRSLTTQLYSYKEEEFVKPEPKPGETKIMLIGQKNDTLGDVLLQFDSSSKVHICKNADNAIVELRTSGYDALIILGVGQGDVNLRLCNDIRADSRLFNLPVLFVLDNESNREAAYIHGASDIILNPSEMDNLNTRTALHVGQAHFRFSLQQLLKASKPLPVIDGPTGLYSFGFLKAHMASLMADHMREDKVLTVASLNVTNLQAINDEYGYPAGDLVLRQIGSIISFLVRGEDFCGRYKNGQFLIALPSTSRKDALIALNRVYGVIRNTDFSVVSSDSPVSATVEMGLAEMQSEDTLDQVIARGGASRASAQ